MSKLHKSPLSTQPVCSDHGSLPHGLGQWVHQLLHPIVKDQDTCFKTSFELIKLLDPLCTQNNRLFTYNAVSMYTKIGTKECINRLGDFLKLLAMMEFYGICPKATIKQSSCWWGKTGWDLEILLLGKSVEFPWGCHCHSPWHYGRKHSLLNVTIC